MKASINNQILAATGAAELVSTHHIQTLWSGYGEIFRCQLTGGKHEQIVVKHVKLPDQSNHPRGWNSDISHQRKLKSYQVEINWYKGLAKQADDACKLPRLIHAWQEEGEMLMIMEDLNASGFPKRMTSITLDEIKNCLSWLAKFHAKYMDQKPEGLWEIGSYWHLDTRPDELEAMQNMALKQAAKSIDEKLKSCKYQTIIHGDAKLANFCFSEDGSRVAAVDFQYVGGGCGMKDVAYFLSSCLTNRELEKFEQELLRYYFNILVIALDKYSKSLNIQEVIDSYEMMYNYAWSDFYRFLDGWSPGHWKMNGYSKRITEWVVDELSNGQ
ncbi:MAG: DUF1679 domain-containing protein [Cyclobacteriaceae bacterium]